MDLIDRQAAIDAILNINDYGNSDRANALGLAEFAITTLPSAHERKTGQWLETEGLDEEIRCLMCTNHMRSDRGCDGHCQHDEHLYNDIMSALERRMMEVEHETD